MNNPFPFFLFVSLIFLSACNTALPDSIQQEMARLPDKIDYNFHVKPILSDRCFACHGPDAQNQEAGLRLDIESEAFAALESGNGYAIVPGKIHKSELVQRILSDDAELVMPSSDSNLKLNDQEKALLIKWIEQGAEYKAHWAFEKPQKSAVPVTDKSWSKNEIDHFVANKLQQNNIQPAPIANREQLIRRLYFDLTGLPPTLAELNHWMEDTKPDYYEQLVETLLANPAFGERMAAHWMDVARFADSEGYLDDFHHAFHPYRDWVIDAFNKNLPYDQFILWQVGGDQMPDATPEQKLATAFNRNHKQNSEGGIIPEEFRVEYVVDRTHTVGAAFMGMTFGCARCHDHKYDPISQKDFYQLYSFFNSTIERGDGIFGFNAVENGQNVPNYLSMNAGPVLPLLDSEVEKIHNFLLNEIDAKQKSIAQLASTNQTEFQNWQSQQKDSRALIRAVQSTTVNHLTFDNLADGKDRDLASRNKAPKYWGSISSEDGKKGKAIRSVADGQYIADGRHSSFERMEPFTISFWVNTPKAYEEGHVMYNGNNRIQGYRGWDIVMDSTTLHFRLNHAHPYQSLDISPKQALPLNEWTHFVWTYDGSSDANGMQLYQNGQIIDFTIHRNHLYRSTEPYTDTRATVYMPYSGLIIGNRHYDQDFTGGLIDEVRILNKAADPLTARYLYDEEQGKTAFEAALTANSQELDAFYDTFIDKNLAQERSVLRAIQAKELETIDTVREIMVMSDSKMERPTYILERGIYDAHGEPVQRDVPADILPFPEELPRNRYGLGQWLIHPDHPLTARVAVNQIWYLMFGRGLVETVEDFGNQGALPTHPALLDWLAVDFQENGWDLKRLIHQIVTSATYQQSSVIRPELNDIDPDNYLLARGPRYRRSAEMVRDNILAASGLLESKIGGPSVFPYQPPGLWKETTSHPFFPGYKVDYENGLYRRSLYTFFKRNMPPPSMLIFDAANRGECQVRRKRSNTPLQALVLLNDPQMIEGCRVLAEKMWRAAEGDIATAATNTFRLLTSRMPTEKEKSILMAQFQDELYYFKDNPNNQLAFLAIGHRKFSNGLPQAEIASLARVANTVLNSTEAYYKN